jgi:alpha-tubulin suppressor-like RCC1 family protein
VAAGTWHSLFVKSDGSLWGMGSGSDGELGDGTYNRTNTQPEEIVTTNIVAIGVGNAHSLFLKSDGSLWAMGANYNGQLGDGGLVYGTNRPEQIVSNGVVAISGGYLHNLFLKSDNSLWGTGYDADSELGDGFTNDCRLVEQILPSLQPVLEGGISSKTNLQVNATCQFGGTFYLLRGTNLAQSSSQWIPVATNFISNRTNNVLNVTLTNAVNPGGRLFYILQSE